jgi:hypothetical protein
MSRITSASSPRSASPEAVATTEGPSALSSVAISVLAIDMKFAVHYSISSCPGFDGQLQAVVLDNQTMGMVLLA